MASTDPLAALGLGPAASAEDIQSARRRLAKSHHPDRGGDPARMRAINEAADAALSALDRRAPERPESRPHERTAPPRGSTADAMAIARDVPSFTVEALPVETFEAMLVVASWLGEVLDDDPPYRLDTYLYEPFDCWCRLEVVPDAGASTVSLAVAGLDGSPTPDVLAVRDAWVANLNALDWP